MAEWFDFYIYSIGRVVSTMFSLPTGLGFTYGHIDVALIVIGLVASALVLKFRNLNSDVASYSRDVHKLEAKERRFRR